jgi:hypothetical protein
MSGGQESESRKNSDLTHAAAVLARQGVALAEAVLEVEISGL